MFFDIFTVFDSMLQYCTGFFTIISSVLQCNVKTVFYSKNPNPGDNTVTWSRKQ